jgi:hypothetical protein
MQYCFFVITAAANIAELPLHPVKIDILVALLNGFLMVSL